MLGDRRLKRWLLRDKRRRHCSCRIVVLSELYAILLEDILVLLQKQDERLILKFHGKNQAGAADAKNIFSPVIKLNTVLVRPVATGESSVGF